MRNEEEETNNNIDAIFFRILNLSLNTPTLFLTRRRNSQPGTQAELHRNIPFKSYRRYQLNTFSAIQF